MEQLLVVVHTASPAQVVDVALEPLHRDPVAPPGERDLHRVRRLGDLPPQRPAQDLRHADVALEHGHLGAVLGPDRHPRGEPGHGRLVDVDLPQGGQHLLDVAEERTVGAHDEDAGPGQSAAVRVEQVGRAVQPDGGLPGTRRALHADRLVEWGPHDVVLVGLDGGDDVAHRAAAGALDLLPQELPRLVRGPRGIPGQGLVLVPGQLAAGEAESTPTEQPLRSGGAGLVERPAHGGPPVDDHGVARVVADVPAADVEDLPRAAGGQGVGAAEEGRYAGIGGQRAQPLGPRGAEPLGRPGVHPCVGDRSRGGPHPDQAVGRPRQVGSFGGEHGIGVCGLFSAGVRHGRWTLRRSVDPVTRAKSVLLAPSCGPRAPGCGRRRRGTSPASRAARPWSAPRRRAPAPAAALPGSSAGGRPGRRPPARGRHR